MRGKKIVISVFDTVKNEFIYNNMTLAEVSKAMGIKYKTIANAKSTGSLIHKRYQINEMDNYIEPVKDKKTDDYALEWEVREYCEKLRQHVGLEILCGIGLHGITEEGQIVR